MTDSLATNKLALSVASVLCGELLYTLTLYIWTELEILEGDVCGIAINAKNLELKMKRHTTAFVAVPHLSM